VTSTEHGAEPDVAGDGTPDAAPDPADGDPGSDADGRSTPVDPAEITPIDPATADATTRRGRLEFLDAIRGLAAVAVMLGHFLEPISTRYSIWEHEVFRPGEYGVVLFFVTSGFIIPASLERHGAVGRFWVGRVFRLFPLYWTCIIAAFVLHETGHFGLPADWHGAQSWLLNLTMVQNFITGPQALGNAWTLAYEMVFYLGMTLLFISGRHRRSIPIAMGLLLGSIAVGTFVPNRLLWPFVTRHWVIVGAIAAMLAASTLTRVPRSWRSRALAVGLSAVVVAGVANRPEDLFLSIMFFGTMFVGTVVHRAMHGQLPVRTAVIVYATAMAMMVVAFLTNLTAYADPSTGARINWHAESLTFLGAYATFAVGIALRHLHFPRVVTYVGKISYSLYLVHPLVLYSIPQASSRPVTYGRWVVAGVIASMATYHLVELPFQRWGRRLARKVPVHPDDIAAGATF
jgi:peptidoglycan/LPS O-acetylase OafA/YrhL